MFADLHNCGGKTTTHSNKGITLRSFITSLWNHLSLFVPSIYQSIYLSIYPISLGTVGAPHDVATNIRHSCRSSALLTASLLSKPVQSRMLSSHRFLCLPFFLPPRKVPWRTVLASPEALVTCQYHFILRLFTVD